MMQVDPRLHHCAQNVTQGSLETVLEMYKILNCEVVYRPDNGHRWAMVGQMQLRFAIQVVEIDSEPISAIEAKRQTHVAFLSDDPQGVIKKIENWAKANKVRFSQGGWSEKERYFDLPDLFINFVIEVMHTSIEEGEPLET